MSATHILDQPVSLETSKTKEPEQRLLDVVCRFDVVQTTLERLIHGFRDCSGTTAARKADRCREIAVTWWPTKNCQSNVSINRHRGTSACTNRYCFSPEGGMLGCWIGLPDILLCWACHGQPAHKTLKLPDKALRNPCTAEKLSHVRPV